MFLPENESKLILKEYGINVPRGSVAVDADAAMQAAAEFNGPVVLKALVASGGRGKLGGVRFADTSPEVLIEANRLLNMELAGEKVTAVLVEEKLSIREELYLGVSIDLFESRPVIIFCMEGGMDIEETVQKIHRYYPDLLNPVEYPHLVEFLQQTGLNEKYIGKVADTLERLIHIFFNCDAITVEINPLMITELEEVVAADAKLLIDDSACFRQKNLTWERPDQILHPLERKAGEAGLSLVLLNGGGDIGLICGGAGLGMATMDTIAYYGGKTANFLDTGGGLSVTKMAKALEIVLEVPNIKGVLINVFGGVNSCFNVARGVAEAIDDPDISPGLVPIVVKMQGHFQEEGWALLEQYAPVSLIKAGDTDDAVQKILSLI